MLCWKSLCAALLYLAFKIAFEDSAVKADPRKCGGRKVCPHNSKCTNTTQGLICLCLPGYEETQGDCEDIDECAQDECGDVPCVNKDGSHTCNCPTGFQFDKTNKTCVDVDECSSGVNECGIDRQCSNTEGSFECVCYEGFKDVPPDICMDIDECLIPGACGDNGVCNNTEGSYNCTCATGYDGVGKKCEDIDECKTMGLDRVCPEELQCINSQGSYFCQECSDKLILNIYTNECEVEGLDICTPSPCKPPATCEIKNSDFLCTCPSGYEVKGKTECQEIEACKSNPCGANGKCKKDGKSFKCECHSGYKFDTAKGCLDVDECAMNLCKGATCSNSQGSYECQCPKGSTYDAKTGCKSKAVPVASGSYRPVFSPFCSVTLMTISFFVLR